jgi:hypothetical protein
MVLRPPPSLTRCLSSRRPAAPQKCAPPPFPALPGWLPGRWAPPTAPPCLTAGPCSPGRATTRPTTVSRRPRPRRLPPTSPTRPRPPPCAAASPAGAAGAKAAGVPVAPPPLRSTTSTRWPWGGRVGAFVVGERRMRDKRVRRRVGGAGRVDPPWWGSAVGGGPTRRNPPGRAWAGDHLAIEACRTGPGARERHPAAPVRHAFLVAWGPARPPTARLPPLGSLPPARADAGRGRTPLRATPRTLQSWAIALSTPSKIGSRPLHPPLLPAHRRAPPPAKSADSPRPRTWRRPHPPSALSTSHLSFLLASQSNLRRGLGPVHQAGLLRRGVRPRRSCRSRGRRV